MDPFKQMHEWKDNMDSFFGDTFWNEFEHMVKPPIPAVNLYQSENELFLYASLPGIKDRNQIQLRINNSILSLSGSLFPIEERGSLIKQEILQGEFSRDIDLPFPVRKDQISASLRQGLLTVHLHRLVSKQEDQRVIDISEFEE
ncbi:MULTISPECIES: Hsp20/alpha crystallin family protein [Gracilibacillus]|uniref:Hsp20/alpha crystallin family protein n=1 Tax=Gracilibacillus TaxID=74385 RepID=UPI0008250AB8|nr:MULTISPECIES: Hsp20/alpha crystallin family protein [Gracilibacillus]